MRSVLLALVVAAGLSQPAAWAQDRSQGRSMVMSRDGIVASENVLASEVGASILADGGNAVDAAIATNAMMGLVAPMSNGLGGDLFAIIYSARDGKLYGFNGSGWAPAGLTPQFLAAKGIHAMPARGIHSVTVPGAVDAWVQMSKRFGRRRLADLLAPAIGYARRGFPVGEWVSGLWSDSEQALRADPAAAETYLVDGHPPKAGEVFRNPDLAWSYRQIAAKGRDAFYRGEIARRLLATSRAKGGTMSAADLTEYAGQWVEPISTDYRGWQVFELPPNGQGIAALEMLNIMQTLPLGSYGQNSAAALHVMIEAKKLAYADMLRYDADPRFAKVPVEGLLSKEFAARRAALIDPAHAACGVPSAVPPGADTVYLTVVDRQGNMVSLIQSNFASVGFGSGVVVGGAGFTLQNRGALFTLEAGHPNLLAGRKRPVHTIIPAFMQKGDIRISFGIMGGWNQAQAHAQFVSDIVDFAMTIQQAMEAPRFSKETFGGCDVQIEDRLADSVRNQLAALGHQVKLRGAFAPTATGGGQAVLRNAATGVNFGASDPRKDGAAVAELRK
jgi:gamma-glutamyltranspeptidase/glutathione hydrolase